MSAPEPDGQDARHECGKSTGLADTTEAGCRECRKGAGHHEDDAEDEQPVDEPVHGHGSVRTSEAAVPLAARRGSIRVPCDVRNHRPAWSRPSRTGDLGLTSPRLSSERTVRISQGPSETSGPSRSRRRSMARCTGVSSRHSADVSRWPILKLELVQSVPRVQSIAVLGSMPADER